MLASMPGPGVFTLSLDVELAWGEFYRRPVDVARLAEARRLFPDLLRLLERHAIRATFAFVGHLLLEGCQGHPGWPRPRIAWRPGDWLRGDPCTDAARDPLWYAPDLARAVLSAAPGHDLGAHGFSHLPLDDPGVNAEVAAAELAGSRAALAQVGAGAGSSFVFPRNGINYTEALSSHGFACYRGVEPGALPALPRPLRRAGHMMAQLLASRPAVARPIRRGDVVETPGSMLFLSREGFRRHIPMRSRVLRAERGLAAAAASGSVFHLWLHAEDLVPESGAMLAGLDAVLAQVAARARGGDLVVRTMAELGAGA